MTAEEFGFFRKYLREFAESLFLREVIDSRQCSQLRSFANTTRGKACAMELFSRGVAVLREYDLRLELKQLREMNRRHFYHIEVTFTFQRCPPRRVCFVGHRFVSSVEKTLRWNLCQVLEPHNIRLDWSGKDPRSVQIFDDIVRRIRKADFCIFDNRATAGRPNVYIEAGIAYALKTPFILFEYVSKARTSNPDNS